MEAQRSVELEALGFCKSVNALHQRAAKWKAEQKRLRNALEVRPVDAFVCMCVCVWGRKASKAHGVGWCRHLCQQGMDKFEDWAVAVETDLQSIAGNLEYVCSVLEKEREQSSAVSAGAGASST